MTTMIGSPSSPSRPYQEPEESPPSPGGAGLAGPSQTTPAGALDSGGRAGSPGAVSGTMDTPAVSSVSANPDLALDPPDSADLAMGQAEAAMYLSRVLEDFVKEFGTALTGLNDQTMGTMRDLAAQAAKVAKDAMRKLLAYQNSPLRKLGKWLSMGLGVLVMAVVAAVAVKVALITGGAATPIAVWMVAAAATQLAEFIATVVYDAQGKDGLPDAFETGAGRAMMGFLKADIGDVFAGTMEACGVKGDEWIPWVSFGLGIVALAVSAKGAAKWTSKVAAEATAEVAARITRFTAVMNKTQAASGTKDGVFSFSGSMEQIEAAGVQQTVDNQQADAARIDAESDSAGDRYRQDSELANKVIQQLSEVMETMSSLLNAYVDGFKSTASTPQHA